MLSKFHTIITGCLAVLVIVLAGRSCSIETEYNDNMNALQDTLRSYKLSNGSLLSEKLFLEGSRKDLLERLDLTKKHLKEIESKVGKVRVATKIESQFITDTLYTTIRDTIVDSTVLKSFHYKDCWLSLQGTIKDSLSFQLQSNVPLIVGMSNKKVFVESPNPYIRITDINTVKLRQPRWSFGVYGGFGVTYGTRGVDIGPQIGVGLSYKL